MAPDLSASISRNLNKKKGKKRKCLVFFQVFLELIKKFTEKEKKRKKKEKKEKKEKQLTICLQFFHYQYQYDCFSCML